MTLMRYLRDSQNKRLVVGGHRGHQSDVRENTIKNFRQLIGKNIPYVEIDVQLTRDDQLVIFHDSRLETATELSGTIRDYSLDQLREHFEIDTVEETIKWCGENHMGIGFELKTFPLRSIQERRVMVEKLCKLISCYAFYQNCFVFGKDYDALSIIKESDPEINIGVIAPACTEEALPVMKRLRGFLYLDYLDRLSESLVKDLHGAGYLVDGSVVNTEEALRVAMELGVDMIESDYPERVLNLLTKIEGESRNT